MGSLESILSLIFALLVEFADGFGDAEGFGVEGGLRDQAVGVWEAEDTSNACGQTEEEYVPVEASWFSERELAALGDQRRD